MNRIKLLPDSVIGQIKAGEVIERPASVVKELVENSIDAGCDEIRVEIMDGGKKLIRVMDNGHGIFTDDVPLAFFRHSTSKIDKMEDISSIISYGFRGEALASVAICSHCVLTSKTEEEETGTRIIYHFGAPVLCEKVSFNRGTMVEVTDIFREIPARRKFLKASYRERYHIYSVFKQLSIPNSQISFRLESDLRETFFFQPRESSLKRIQDVLNMRECELIHGSFERDNYRASLFLPKESSVSARASASYIYVNRRFVKIPLLMYNMKELMSTAYAKNEKPFYILMLDIQPQEIDVNAHPQKLEVRCENVLKLIAFIKEAFENLAKRYYSGISFKDKASDNCLNCLSSGKTYDDPDRHLTDFINRELFMGEPAEVPSRQAGLFSGDIRIIGQVFSSYIIAEYNEKLYLVDQHALYEEYRYEYLMKSYKAREKNAFTFLSPLIFDIGAENAEIVMKFQDMISSLGFEMEVFSNNSIIVRKIPYILRTGNTSLIISDIINNLREREDLNLEKLIGKILSSVACHTSLRANYELTPSHQKFLSRMLFSLEKPKCPHNRPVFIELERKDVEQMFRRRA